MSLLASWLSAAGLASLHPVFVSYGVTEQSFVELQFQDYDAMGIFEPPERQRLFKLIQQVKRQQQAQAQPAAQTVTAAPQPQPQAVQQPALLPSQPQPVQQPVPAVPQSQQQQPQPQFTAPPQPPKPTAVPRPSVAPTQQSAPPTTRRIDQLSQPRDRAIVERAASISMSPAAASYVASASPSPSHSPPLASPRASYSAKRRSGVGSFDMPPAANPPPQPQPPQQHTVQHEEHARVSRLLDDDDTGMDGDEDDDDDDTINSSMAAIDLSTASSSALDAADPYNSKIRVAVRKRPINSKEKSQGQLDVATVNTAGRAVTIHEPKVKVDLTKYVESHRFCFDEVFDENGTNEEIYAATCKPLIPFFLNKGKATCFAYGQTGSGKSAHRYMHTSIAHMPVLCESQHRVKHGICSPRVCFAVLCTASLRTFTMMGPNEVGRGLYALAARDIFTAIATYDPFHDIELYVSFFEIYGGKLFDLLNERARLVCREDAQKAVNVVGLTERRCQRVEELLDVITYGNTVRSTGSTGANIDSSRSHAILQMDAKRVVKKPGQKGKLKLAGRFSFIDLAGSERAADTSDNDRRTRMEGAEINKSLLALKECIRALDQGGKHLPFRGSQLTQVLKDSFVGNSRTIMIANISPNSGSCEHTLNTLRYADRVKELKSSGPTGGAMAGQPAGMNGAVGGAGGVAGAKKPAFDAYMPHQGNKSNVKVRPGAISTQDDVSDIAGRPVPLASPTGGSYQSMPSPTKLPRPSIPPAVGGVNTSVNTSINTSVSNVNTSINSSYVQQQHNSSQQSAYPTPPVQCTRLVQRAAVPVQLPGQRRPGPAGRHVLRPVLRHPHRGGRAGRRAPHGHRRKHADSEGGDDAAEGT